MMRWLAALPTHVQGHAGHRAAAQPAPRSACGRASGAGAHAAHAGPELSILGGAGGAGAAAGVHAAAGILGAGQLSEQRTEWQRGGAEHLAAARVTVVFREEKSK